MDKETILQQLDQLKLNVETYIHGTSNVQHISSNTVQYKLNEIEKGLAPILDRIKKRVTVKTIKRQPSVESIPEFNSFQYWKIPLPDLSDNELVMFVGDTVGADAVGDQTPQLNSNIPIYEVDDLVRYHRRMHLLQQALKKDMEEDILKLEKSKKRVSRLVTGTPNRVVVNNTHNITNVITPATIILNQQPHFQQQQPVIANSTTPVVEHHHHYYGGAAPQPQTILALLSPPASHPHPNEMLAASTPKSPTSQQHQQPLAEFGNLGNRGDIDQWAGDSSTAIITPTQASLQAAKGNNVRAATSAATAFFPATTTAHSDVKPVGALQPPQTSSAAHFVDMSNAHSSGAIPPIQEMRSLGKHENKNNRSGVIATPSSTPPSAQYFNYKAYWDQHAPTTTSTPTPATTALSSATLLESSSHVQNTSAVNFGDILGENRRSSKSSSFNKALFANNNNDNDIIVMGGDGRDGGKSKKTTSKINSSLIFRLANLGRSIALAIYGTNITQTQYLNNPIFQQLHAQPLFIATLIFLWLDVVIALIKTFPTVFWVCWDVKTFDALNDDSRVWTIFALVADHDLITDLIPGILNLILKIYSYRLIEVALDPTYTTSLSDIFNLTITDTSQLFNPQYNNTVLLYLFVASLAFTLVFHSVKLSYRLASEKGALTLAILVLVKAVLLGFDIATLSYLLYEMLVVNGTSLLNPGNSNVAMMVSIAGPSPLVSLLTNSLVNVPLYYCFLRMKMRGKRDVKTMQSGESIGVWRVVRASVAKSMHPLVSSIFGSYQIYAVVAMLVCYNSVYGSVNWIGVPGTSTYATFNSMFWINLIVNYFPGALVSTFYWLEVVVCGLFGNSSKQ